MEAKEKELLYNTLHPFGYARFLDMLAKFLCDYDDDIAHRWGVGVTCGGLYSISQLLRGLDISDLDWKEFCRRHPPLEEPK